MRIEQHTRLRWWTASPVPLVMFLASGLAQGQGYVLCTFDGPAAGAGQGKVVSAGGDVDADGLPDLVVSAYPAPFATIAASGQVRVYSGATGATLFTFSGGTPTDGFGFASAGAGDVDADGHADVVVGSPGIGSAGGIAQPRVQVFSGLTGGLLFAAMATQPLGQAVAGAGDANGDGLADVISSFHTPLFCCGFARVHSGANGSTLFSFLGLDGTVQHSNSVAGVGDIDGDGADDVLIGDPFFDPPSLGDAGRAVALSGASGAVLFTFNGIQDGGWRGASVAGCGDIDGDGVPDLLIGAPNENPAGPGAGLGSGLARVFSGATGNQLLVVGGGAFGEHFGWSVAGTGDADGDAVPDLLAGAPDADPAGSIDAGRAGLFSGSSGSVLASFSGTGAGDRLGLSVTGPGDVNADSFADLAMGSPGADPAGLVDAGRATVISLVGIPGGSSIAGAGCPGTSGSVPLLQTLGGSPSPGNSEFGLTLSRALGGANTLLLIGTSPLALGLGPLGLPGCTLLLLPEVAFAAPTNGSGIRVFPAPVPPDASLVGGIARFQWYVADPGPGALPGAMTQRLDVLVVP
ncbi:MAG: VCBS repeat-containing protein [Planctomycetes bacterium]|nr:VCBS repeat-containing protein [Planctomycetota bacterium]